MCALLRFNHASGLAGETWEEVGGAETYALCVTLDLQNLTGVFHLLLCTHQYISGRTLLMCCFVGRMPESTLKQWWAISIYNFYNIHDRHERVAEGIEIEFTHALMSRLLVTLLRLSITTTCVLLRGMAAACLL